MESAQEERSPKCYAGGRTGVAVGWAAWQTVGRQGKGDGEEVRHFAVGTGAGVQA